MSKHFLITAKARTDIEEIEYNVKKGNGYSAEGDGAEKSGRRFVPDEKGA